jgi:hypothetical protein
MRSAARRLKGTAKKIPSTRFLLIFVYTIPIKATIMLIVIASDRGLINRYTGNAVITTNSKKPAKNEDSQSFSFIPATLTLLLITA